MNDIKQALARTLDPAEWPDGPDVLQVSGARQRAGMTQRDAAALVWRTTQAWEKWESVTVARSRQMNPALWFLWCLRVAAIKGWPVDWQDMTPAAFARMVAANDTKHG